MSSANIVHSSPDLGFSRTVAIWKEFLNQISERAQAAAERRQLAALPLRHLDDIGMTEAERAAILGYDGQPRDPWALMAIHRL